jgi:hypothetical protein
MKIISFLSIFGLILSEIEEIFRMEEVEEVIEMEESSCGCGKILDRNLIDNEIVQKGLNVGPSNCENPEMLAAGASDERMVFVEGGKFYMGTSKPMIRLVNCPPRSSDLIYYRMENHHNDWFN